MEYLDLYDENKKIINETILRSKNMKIPNGKYINIVIVFIQNSNGEFLIQKTSKQKDSIWATTGGLVKSGLTNDEAIVEEMKEELGIIVDQKDLKLFYTEKRERAFQDAYYVKMDININKLTLQKEEVEYVKWLNEDKINELIEKDEFRKGNINAFKYLLDMIK